MTLTDFLWQGVNDKRFGRELSGCSVRCETKSVRWNIYTCKSANIQIIKQCTGKGKAVLSSFSYFPFLSQWSDWLLTRLFLGIVYSSNRFSLFSLVFWQYNKHRRSSCNSSCSVQTNCIQGTRFEMMRFQTSKIFNSWAMAISTSFSLELLMH